MPRILILSNIRFLYSDLQIRPIAFLSSFFSSLDPFFDFFNISVLRNINLWEFNGDSAIATYVTWDQALFSFRFER